MVNSYINNTGVENIQNFTGFLQSANASASGSLFAGIDILIFFIIFLSITSTVGSWEIGLLTAGFISMILSILFVYMGVLSMTIAGIFVGVLVVGILYVMFNRNN